MCITLGSCSNFRLPHLHLTSLLEWGPHQNIAITFGLEKLQCSSYPWVKKFQICLFILTKYMNVTDGQTPRDGIDCIMHGIARQKWSGIQIGTYPNIVGTHRPDNEELEAPKTEPVHQTATIGKILAGYYEIYCSYAKHTVTNYNHKFAKFIDWKLKNGMQNHRSHSNLRKHGTTNSIKIVKFNSVLFYIYFLKKSKEYSHNSDWIIQFTASTMLVQCVLKSCYSNPQKFSFGGLRLTQLTCSDARN